MLKVLETALHGDGPAVIEQWGQNNPQGLIIGRLTRDGNTLESWEQQCDQLLNTYAPHKRLFHVMEVPYSEIYQRSDDHLAEFTTVNIQCADYIRDNWQGIQIAGGNFSVGNPEIGPLQGYEGGESWEDWDIFSEALPHLDYLSLHEYGTPSMRTAATWHCLRFRRVYDYFEEKGYSLIPLLLTECGIDHGLVKEPRNRAGWRRDGSAIAYAKDLVWWRNELAVNPYVVGAAIFLCGCYGDLATNPMSGWQSFEVAGVPEIAAVVNEVISIPPAVAPTPALPTEAPVVKSSYEAWRDTPGNKHPLLGPNGAQPFMQHLENVGKPRIAPDFLGRMSDWEYILYYGFPAWKPDRRLGIKEAVIPQPVPTSTPKISPTDFGYLADSVASVLKDADSLRARLLTVQHEIRRLYQLDTSTEQLIALTGAVDVRGILPVRANTEAYPMRSEDEMRDVRFLIVHHTGGGGSHPSVDAVAAYQTGASSHEPFPAIAYTMHVEPDGELKLCHPLEAVTWANGSGSSTHKKNIGIRNWHAIALHFSGDDPNNLQMSTIESVWHALQTILPAPRIEILGHAEYCVDRHGAALTVCPGTAATKAIAAIRGKWHVN